MGDEQQALKAKLQENSVDTASNSNGDGSAEGVSVAEVEVERVEPNSPVDPTWSKLPTEQKLDHKVWNNFL
jgi:hypothetical protein